MPDRAKNITVRRSSIRSSPCLPKASAIAHANIRTTVVRMAVARFESTCATPTLARSAVAAAKSAERSAHPLQVMQSMLAAGPQILSQSGPQLLAIATMSESMNRQTNLLSLAALAVLTGCGYHTVGTATHLPPAPRSMAVPVFATHTEA